MKFARTICAITLALSAGVAQAEDAARLYMLHCSGCHGMDGAGSKTGRIPPFPGFVGPIAQASGGRSYLVLVPGVENAGLSDADTAGVLNYVLATWSARESVAPYSAAEVRDIRRERVDDIASARRKIADELAPQGVSIRY
jgi:mono/diheme cytochrome c family protein